MCGIAGCISLKGDRVEQRDLQCMTDAIAHRGPDGEGHWHEGNVGLGHRRLAIIDPTPTGHQPMVSKDGRWVLVYNGEVYNYRELRSELAGRGVVASGASDTEVVLNALVYWGPDALLKFNGMFALALWDRRDLVLLLARDRYGIKPVYWSMQGGVFSFGSEQKAITALPHFRRELNEAALLEYFTFQNIFTDQTLLRDISMLPAGSFLRMDGKTGAQQIRRYWDYRFREPETKRAREEYCDELDSLFTQAVRRQLVSDVELGSYLSGGVDSGSITAVASKYVKDLKTFTCGFDLSSASGIELAYDERAKAEAMSARFKTEHYEMVLKAGDMERSLPAVAKHVEEPRVGQSYPNYYAAKLTSKFVKVVLSGSGGDELFGGYPWRYYRAANAQGFEDYVDQYYMYWQRMVSNSELRAMFDPIWPAVNHVWTRDIFRDVFSTHDNELNRPEDYINHSLYFEAKTFLHGLFVVEDKLSMAHGLESRVPFMDNDLVDFAMSCPVGLKLNNLAAVLRINENLPADKPAAFFERTKDGKQILRDVLARYVPPEISQAQKQGFSSPDASWFKGESIDFVRHTIHNKSAHIYNFMDPAAVIPMVDEHLRGQRNRRLLIWSLLNFEQWLTAELCQ